MTTITSLNRTTTTPAMPAMPAAGGASASPAGGVAASPATVVSIGAATPALSANTALLWENRTRSGSAALMAQNIANQPLAGRLKGLGGELLKQIAYDGADFSQSVQLAPEGAQANTYDMLVAPSQVSRHGMGDNQFALDITTRSGVKVTLKLDAGDNSIAVEAKADGELTETERKALGKLSDAFQKAIDGLTEDPPHIDLAGLTQFDSGALASVDLKGQVKLNAKDTQTLAFHADSTQRTLSFNGPAGSASIGVDLSEPRTWGGKAQQATALKNYLDQVEQAGVRGRGNRDMIGMFKDAFTGMNADYGTPPAASPMSIALTDQDHAMTTGLADFNASFSQTEVQSNPMRPSEKDTFAYDLSQKTSISGTSQLDRGISQQQQAHLKARYHAPVKEGARLALDLTKESQNYKYITIDDSASSTTDIGYDKGVLAKATLETQAHQSMRVLQYTLGKLQSDHTTPSGRSVKRDLLDTLEPERAGLPRLSDAERAQVLAKLNQQIFLQSDPGLIPA
ncbi:hypothetical protein FHW58_003643 [Duganella sp. 1224]|uniref:hypothetical protein n=1 Tax=Duganella sp. 1224 TaxID=2587052 RepID=UPI0017B3E3BC|nr:hypothetical protein [Duganella sp. 1224]NYE62428.1 hypothetical protein [Duganella sp. 1224]